MHGYAHPQLCARVYIYIYIIMCAYLLACIRSFASLSGAVVQSKGEPMGEYMYKSPSFRPALTTLIMARCFSLRASTSDQKTGLHSTHLNPEKFRVDFAPQVLRPGLRRLSYGAATPISAFGASRTRSHADFFEGIAPPTVARDPNPHGSQRSHELRSSSLLRFS